MFKNYSMNQIVLPLDLEVKLQKTILPSISIT
ncbi:hypothetical protein BACCIP111883_01677 [Sutcliffiella rhizosphaerae]|uniref:Transposase n=1 Tax=Sutcliffiella rhizosphaerae TaxID=2880967 RepID=A0ABM8YLR9_9BACI|nr:hypothetical protein BACCIP111883_01677 [Sutcliffiella rhizosphaerae]